MQDDETAPWQHATADLGSEIMKFGKEMRRKILLPLRVGTEEWRHQRCGGALVGKRRNALGR